MAKTKQNSLKLARGASLALLLLGLASCNGNRSPGVTTSDSADGAKKDEELGTTSDDTADDSAPVSGAYLTCYVPPSQPGDTNKFAGCNATGKDGKELAAATFAKLKWGYVGAKSKTGQRPISVYDLRSSKRKYKFQVIYSMELPKSGKERTSSGNYFLSSAPVLRGQGFAKKPPTKAGLKLSAEPTGLTNFRFEQTHHLNQFAPNQNLFANDANPNFTWANFFSEARAADSGVVYVNEPEYYTYSADDDWDISGGYDDTYYPDPANQNYEYPTDEDFTYDESTEYTYYEPTETGTGTGGYDTSGFDESGASSDENFETDTFDLKSAK